MKVLSWICQIGAAIILAQTLFFKFTGAPESVYSFRALGVEPWGRYGTGALELVAVVLLLTPKSSVLGALLAAGLMVGALFAHLTRLGVVVQGDGGLLFGLALTTLTCAAVVLLIHRKEIPVIGHLL
jgi:hypothetical protein